MKDIFIKFVFLLTAGIIAVAPNITKAQTTDDEYEWRYISWTVSIDDTGGTWGYLRWAFKKNGEPIDDTTYTLNVAGTTYVCGIYADTVVNEPDSDFAWVVKYEYIEQPYDSLATRGSADFEGDSVGTGNKWVHVTNVKYLYPSFEYWDTEQNTFYQQYDDGSVYNNAGAGVGYTYGSTTYEKSYMVDNTVYTLSIPLSIEEPINKPQIINLKVYPNPANIYFNVKLSNKSKGVLTLYDLESRVIDKKIINNKSNVKIDASGLNSGNYILVFETDDGTKVSKRITLVK